MCGCESWTIKMAGRQRIYAFELWCWRRLLRVPLNYEEIKPVNSKGNKFWILIGRTDAEAEAPILWLLDSKSRLIRKDPDAGKDWGRDEKETTEDEMVGWHPISMDMSLNKLQEMWRIGKSGMLQSMGWWRVGHDWVTEQQQITWIHLSALFSFILLTVILWGFLICHLSLISLRFLHFFL